ncbi:MAG: error-prone DNA polymerase [Minicystis sp.]
MDPLFAELCARSCFSFLEGASHPQEIVAAAHEMKLAAVAICDRDGLYGSARAYAASKEIGQKIITGAEVTLEPAGMGTAVLLAIDHEGYSNLCALLTAAHADHDKGEAGLLVERVAASPGGLIAILPVDARGADPHDDVFGPISESFGDRAFTATWIHRDGFDGARLAAARAAERRFGTPAIATARPLYHHPSRKPLADILHCIRHGTTLDRAGAALGPNAEATLRSGARMLALFRDDPELVHRTVEIAEACRFSLAELRYHFPSETLCRPGESPDEALRRLVGDGCRRRYPDGTPPDVRDQIEKELAIIAGIGVAPYFLSVHQIVEIARARKILCQGRGSAANSAVCFVLGVTAVDPSRVSLLFERFLSNERAEPPDIDVDFEHERREEVIQEIYALHGRDRAAMVSEVISYRGRSALREVGKVFGLSTDQLDRLSGLVMHMDAQGLSDERLAEAGLDPEDGRLQQVVRWADALEGFPRHLSIHVGGFVISSRPLTEVAPIEPARMEGRTVIPWDKDDIDELGFFKIDVLGLGMLTAIRKALAMIHGGAGEDFDPIESIVRVPAEDPRVYAAIQRADVIGVFQIESRAQMSMLPRLKPKEFYDLVIEVAIVRPGPIQGGMVHPYLRRRTGRERPIPPHPCLAPILKRTLGVPLFQEQVMQIAMVGAGYTAGEADQLRRDMSSWKKHGRLARHREKLLAGFEARGISRAFGEKLYQQIHGFGEYGFPESHAASFALLVYASAWIKTYYPAHFACALLNAQPMGFYSPSSIVKDAQRHRVEARPPCVMASMWDSTLEPPPMGSRLPAIRLGLRQIRGLGQSTGEAIVRARAEAPLASLRDLVNRAGLKKNDVEALAEAGALATLVPERREALWRARAPREGGLFDGIDIERDEDVGLPRLRPIEQLALDYGRVGLSIDDHPMAHLRADLARRGARRAEDSQEDGARHARRRGRPGARPAAPRHRERRHLLHPRGRDRDGEPHRRRPALRRQLRRRAPRPPPLRTRPAGAARPGDPRPGRVAGAPRPPRRRRAEDPVQRLPLRAHATRGSRADRKRIAKWLKEAISRLA